MAKRVGAILLLILFVFVIINVFVLQNVSEIYVFLYIALCIVGLLLIFMSKKPGAVSKEDFLDFEVGYGKRCKKFVIPTKNFLGELRQNDFQRTASEEELIQQALANPIGTPKLSEIVKPGKKIVIVTSDITRPMPTRKVLPAILAEIEAAGCSLADVTVVFALGSHRKHTEEEQKYLVGEESYGKVNCVDSDPTQCTHMGVTSRGTPVDIFSVVAEADYRICLGNIEYHYFAGYSGGSKAIMPGVSTREAIQANHSAMVKAEAKAGNIETNPVRQDIDEVCEKFVPVDFILNVVLDEKKEIICAVAGHFIQAHREGCKFLDKLYAAEIPEKADIVITTPHGYPKDINLYQAQKALDNAKHAVKDGGIIILVAACTEGLGEGKFEKWILNSTTCDAMISDIQDHFELGGHKAAAIALVRKKAQIFCVSELPNELAEKIFMKPYKDVNTALQDALKEMGKDATVYYMPVGGSTLPTLIE